MLFNSIEFLLFFPIAALGYYIFPHKIRYIWLLICSYYFYMCWNPGYALLVFLSTGITFLSGLIIGRIVQSNVQKEKMQLVKKLCVAVSFVSNLVILGYFKYTNFLLDNFRNFLFFLHIEPNIPTFDILLPVGISFYTFQALGYTADVYTGKINPEKNFLKYALFVCFFPQLVAGPIERSGHLLPQIDEYHPFDIEKVRNGTMLILWGLFLKMVIADKAAIIVDAIYGNYEIYGGGYLIIATVLFAIQIYCDFSGYSTIALGAAKVMGFELTDNFSTPYFSRTTSGFWRRWHVTLFSWFKDYIYIPLGGSRKGILKKYFNIMIVFFVSGLWHGASWTYIIWGVLNGLWQIVGSALSSIRGRINAVLHIETEAFSHKLLQTVVTFILIDFTWIFFRAPTVQDAVNIINSMLHASNPWILFDDSLFTLGLDWKNCMVLLMAMEVLFVVDVLKYKGFVIHEILAKQGIWLRWTVFAAGFVSVLLFGVWGSGYNEAAFIYFQF